MIVSCPACSTRYDIQPAAIGSAGRKVKCARCGHRWVQAATASVVAAPGPKAKAKAKAKAPAPPPPPPPPPAFEPTTARGAAPAVEATMDRAAPAGMMMDRGDEDFSGLEPRSSSAFSSNFGGDDGFSGHDHDHENDEPAPRRGWRPAIVGLGRWLGLAASVAGFASFLFGARSEIVGLWPPAARLYQLVGLPVEPPGAGLQLQNVKSDQRIEDGVVMLVLEGQIINASAIDREVPPVLAISLGPDHQPVHRWRVPVTQSHLAPGAIATFRSIERDPGVVSELKVTFDGG